MKKADLFFESLNKEDRFDFQFSKTEFIGGTILRGKYKYFYIYPLSIKKFEKLTIDEFKESMQSIGKDKGINLSPGNKSYRNPGICFSS